MHLFVDISSHGFGHLAITAPVINILSDRHHDLRLSIRSALPPALLQQRIQAAFKLFPESSDFGYKMLDATRVDLVASATAYRQAHVNWPARVTGETQFLSALKPDLVLTNVSYLPLAAAAGAGIPAASLCSLNWADLFVHFFGSHDWAPAIHAEMLAAYRSAQTFLRVTPGMAMRSLDNVHCIGPIAALGQKHQLGLGEDKAVLIAMGGIAHRLPVENWPSLPGVRWLLPGDWQCRHPDAIASESFGLSFTDLLCSVDAIITKPGYGTFTEAACNATPVIYQKRADWPEQDCLIDWLQHNGRCTEITRQALETGQIAPALETIQKQRLFPSPPVNGIAQAAEALLHHASS